MEINAKNINLNADGCVAPLGLIVTKSATELGKKINDYLVEWNEQDNVDTYIIDNECPRFSSGDGKGIIQSTVRGKDLFILVDVGNYNCKYNMFGQQNSMSLLTTTSRI